MTQIQSYLTFSGNCREAMAFYKECLGGELTLQTVGESPMADQMIMGEHAGQMIPQMKQSILHSTLTNGGIVLMATDMVSKEGLIKGNSVSLMLNCSSEDEIKDYYAKLSVGGEATHPLENTFWGAVFGALTDKFGNHWLLNYNKPSNN